MRIDKALVQANLCPTRTKAQAAIENSLVFYQNQCITKPSFEVETLEELQIRGEQMPYVSRGGLKLEKALSNFHIDLTNKIVLDIGSSTGGFTDCAFQRGAKAVIAVEVGTDQMDPQLKKNPNLTLYEQTDFRTIELDKIAPAQIAVSDVSFISVTKMIPQLKKLPHLEKLICLIKPQFECGKEAASKYKGVIKNKELHKQILQQVISQFQDSGFYLQNICPSPITGMRGNHEYLALFEQTPSDFTPDLIKLINSCFADNK